MVSDQMPEKPIKNFLTVTEGAYWKDKLGKEGHPQQEEKGKNAEQILENCIFISLDAPHAIYLREVDAKQNYQPTGDKKPWSLIERDIVHLPEFYIKKR
jgi:hypothetical protein